MTATIPIPTPTIASVLVSSPPPSAMGATAPPLATATEDATMRNAIALLAQKDSESALIYALVHDPEFRLATALTSNGNRIVNVTIVRALLQIFDTYEDQLRRFVSLLMLREMVETINWNELFRANSATTAIIREYTCDLGSDFLQAAFHEVLAEIWDTTESYEVNPRLLVPGDGEDMNKTIEANRERLAALATRLLDKIFDAAALFPYQIAKIYRAMEVEMTRLIDRDRRSNGGSGSQRLSAIGEDPIGATSGGGSEERKSNASLPRLSAISEEMLVFDDPFLPRGSLSSGSGSRNSGSGGSLGLPPAKEEFYVHLGGFLFLRFLCPALIMPHKMGLTPNGKPPSKNVQRTLVLVAKLFQSLANNVEYGKREEYMEPFNTFLNDHRAKLFKFYDQICQQAQNDNRRESLILRSNLMPRISQLWGPPGSSLRHSTSTMSSSSSSAGYGYGLMETQPGVSSVEEALNVLRGWMAENVDTLVKEVATKNGKQKRNRNGSVVMVEQNSDVVSSPVKAAAPLKKNVSKRKLKTSKSLSPVPTSGGDGDDDEDEDASGGDEEDPNAAASALQPENVSAEDLDRIIGQTSHRDIQLMKIYYSSLSQAGLQRLLSIHRDDHAHEWTLYRSRNQIDVYRREQTTASRTCSLALRSSSDRQEKFVEMKASVEINATPRQVFKYLKSLEKMNEWDDRVTHMRKVEPLDDGKVVMYRSSPKLSLWPTWLVKPRDSCDLHSFVEKTQVADTYAVLMESVPRPDVPTIKGTVRMSFATGGFLVEPGVVTEANGQTTKLTCLVKADFKGSLPRYLAESICFRQVLSVRVIKLRLETSMQHGNSSWV